MDTDDMDTENGSNATDGTGSTGAAGPDAASTLDAARRAARAIPPLWPLASSVAVNPFLGQARESLARTGERLARVAGTPVTMPRDWYAARIDSGEVTDDDLAAALRSAARERSSHAGRSLDLDALKAAVREPSPAPSAIPTVAELAAEVSGTDWPGLIGERIGAWAGGHFDEGQALWAAPRARGAYAEWRSFATHDLTPEIAGLGGFAAHVVDAPDRAETLLRRAVTRLDLPEAALETYFHRLLVTLGGWSQYARWREWQAELGGGTDTTPVELLAIRLTWEEALFARHAERIGESWQAACAAHAAPLEPSAARIVDGVLQEAVERASQRQLATLLSASGTAPNSALAGASTPTSSTPVSSTPASSTSTSTSTSTSESGSGSGSGSGSESMPVDTSPSTPARPDVQAVFCIDVRSEVFRRALEGLDPGIRTLGFAGFFGLAISHRRFASDVREHRLPVLLNPALATRAGGADEAGRDAENRIAARAARAWGRFKLAAVSSFAFVEAMGPVYVYRLLRDATGLATSPPPSDPPPRLDPPPALSERVAAANGILRAMSLTEGLGEIVMLCGHGANVVNNPHASALQCGACGGYSGESNARLLAALLNETDVRQGLLEHGIEVPPDTLFVGALHDTTTDTVRLFDTDAPSPLHAEALARLHERLSRAGRIARTERALLLPRATDERDIAHRAHDWSEVRPEWGLAGCSAFVAAPRAVSVGKDLGGRVFLHDYDAGADEDFGILELILTAPVVVASWISLQYYGSSVAPNLFGAGDKLLHNVVGGIGVVEGNGGELRSGLPWQSVHDGESLVHEPLRLSVCIAAPREAMSDILGRHPDVRALFDNRWLHLFALDEAGRMSWRYAGDLDWEAVESIEPVPASRAAASGAAPVAS